MDFQIVIEMENTGTQSAGVRFKQNDSNIKLYFDIFENGQSINSQLVLAGNKVGVSFRRSDGVTVVGDCVLDSDYIYYEVKGSELACAGNLYMDLKIMDGNKRYSTQTLLFHVSEDTETDVVESASVHAEELFNAIDSVPGLIDDINTAGQRWIDEFPEGAQIQAEIDSLNSNLYDQKMLGWSVPEECPIQNEVSGNQFIQKVGRIDLGSLNYTKYNVAQGKLYRTPLLTNMKSYGNYDVANAYVNGYVTTSSYARTEKSVSATSSGVDLIDSRYTDETAFKTAMQGVYLYYELATPITKTIDGNEITEQINASLDDYGLVNKFDGVWRQGAYASDDGNWKNTNNAVCNQNIISCSPNDTIRIAYNRQASYIAIRYYKSDKTFLSSQYVQNTSNFETTIPANAYYFNFNIQMSTDITTSTAGHVGVYVNNAIDVLNSNFTTLGDTVIGTFPDGSVLHQVRWLGHYAGGIALSTTAATEIMDCPSGLKTMFDVHTCIEGQSSGPAFKFADFIQLYPAVATFDKIYAQKVDTSVPNTRYIKLTYYEFKYIK